MPKYSIIVPVYKAEMTLGACVDSVLGQRFSNFELILVDDGSPDGSGKICDEYAERDSRVRVIHKENGGVSTARNVGIDAAQGEYIIFLDSDDFVADNYFEVIESGVGSGAELFSFGMYSFVHKKDGSTASNKSGMNIDADFHKECAVELVRFMTDGFFAPPWNKVFLSSVIKEHNVRFPEGVVCYEDYLFSIEYLKHISKIKSTVEPIYYYRCFEAVDHVSKRRWGERLSISRLVYRETENFISAMGGCRELLNLHRFTWSAYTAELHAAVAYDDDGGEGAIRMALRDKGFQRAVRSITPRGRFFPTLSLMIRFHLYGIASKMIKKRI